jgi:cyanate permease
MNEISLFVLVKTCCGRLASAWHLRLFRDSSFVNIVAGLAAFNVANINFSMVLPFLLMDRGLSRSDAALCMSVTAAADIVARLLVPFIRLKHMGARNTLMVAMLALAFTRSCE